MSNPLCLAFVIISYPSISSAFFIFSILHFFRVKKNTHDTKIAHMVMMANDKNCIPMKEPLSAPPHITPLFGIKKAEEIIPQKPADE